MTMIHTLLDEWDVWQRRMECYSRLEAGGQKQLKEILANLDKTSNIEVKGKT